MPRPDVWLKMNLTLFCESHCNLELPACVFSVFMTLETSSSEGVKSEFKFEKRETKNLDIVVHILQNTQNLVIFNVVLQMTVCKEVYKDL